jgi:lipopolysaccharide transport protein LptA
MKIKAYTKSALSIFAIMFCALTVNAQLMGDIFPSTGDNKTEQSGPTDITSNSMDIDLENDIITLYGNVVVDNNDTKILADKIIVYLTNSKDKTETKDKKAESKDKVKSKGKVKSEDKKTETKDQVEPKDKPEAKNKKAEPKDKVESKDKVKSEDKKTETKDQVEPKDKAETKNKKAEPKDKVESKGKVKPEDKKTKTKDKVEPKDKTEKKEAKRLIAIGNVIIIKKSHPGQDKSKGKEKATSGKADYDIKTGEIILTDDPVLFQGSSYIKGDKITLFRGSDRVKVEGNQSMGQTSKLIYNPQK